jgi:hypothetical protein
MLLWATFTPRLTTARIAASPRWAAPRGRLQALNQCRKAIRSGASPADPSASHGPSKNQGPLTRRGRTVTLCRGSSQLPSFSTDQRHEPHS